MVYRVEKLAYIGIEHPVHTLRHHCRVYCRQRLVRIPPGSKPVRESEEIDFVDGTQHLGDRTLNDLIFQGRHPERSLATIRFRDVDPAHRQWPVSAGMHPLAETLQVDLQILLVGDYSFPIDSRTRLPPQSTERSLQRDCIDMMHQCRKPSLLVTFC